MKTYSSHVLRNDKSMYTHTHTHILAHALTVCKGLVTSSPANSVMVFTPMNIVGRMEKGLARKGAEAMLQMPPSPHRYSPPSPGLDRHRSNSCLGGWPASERMVPLQSGPGGCGSQGPSQAPGKGPRGSREGNWV